MRQKENSGNPMLWYFLGPPCSMAVFSLPFRVFLCLFDIYCQGFSDVLSRRKKEELYVFHIFRKSHSMARHKLGNEILLFFIFSKEIILNFISNILFSLNRKYKLSTKIMLQTIYQYRLLLMRDIWSCVINVFFMSLIIKLKI